MTENIKYANNLINKLVMNICLCVYNTIYPSSYNWVKQERKMEIRDSLLVDDERTYENKLYELKQYSEEHS